MPPGKDAYPISSFTYLLVYETQTDAAKGKKLIDFIKWAIHEGEARRREVGLRAAARRMSWRLLDKRLHYGEERRGEVARAWN